MGCSGSKDSDSDAASGAVSSGKRRKRRAHVARKGSPPVPSAEYWASVRKDVLDLAHHLDAKASAATHHASASTGPTGQRQLLPGERDYRAQLRRWLHHYGDKDPPPSSPPRQQPPGDPNDRPFPLPEGVRPAPPSATENDVREKGAAGPQEKRDDEDLLRPWLTSLQPMDTALPEGTTAWTTLPHDVVADGLTTPQQQSLLAARARRGSSTISSGRQPPARLDDPRRMERRREELGRYFVRTYRLRKNVVARYTRWADHMLQGHAKFTQLLDSEKQEERAVLPP